MNAKLLELLHELPENLQQVANDAIYEETIKAYMEGKKDGEICAQGKKVNRRWMRYLF